MDNGMDRFCIIYHKEQIMIRVNLGKNNHQEAVAIAARRFIKSTEDTIKELRKRETYTKPSVKRREKSAAARRAKAKHDKKVEESKREMR